MERCRESDLRARAAAVWATLPPSAVVWLEGDLGAGKTTFVRFLVDAAGGSGATSPTFALVHEYDTPVGMVAHADCYRLRDPDEAIDLDLPGVLATARALLVEWPDRAGGHAPTPDVTVRLAHADDPDIRLLDVRYA